MTSRRRNKTIGNETMGNDTSTKLHAKLRPDTIGYNDALVSLSADQKRLVTLTQSLCSRLVRPCRAKFQDYMYAPKATTWHEAF